MIGRKEGGNNSVKKYRNKLYLNNHSSPNKKKKWLLKIVFMGTLPPKDPEGSEVQVTKI